MKLNRMKKRFITLLATGLAGSSMLVNAASVGTGGVSTAFSKNSTSVGVVVGSGSSFNDNYIILGVGVGYYVFQGLEIGIDLQHWFWHRSTALVFW